MHGSKFVRYPSPGLRPPSPVGRGISPYFFPFGVGIDGIGILGEPAGPDRAPGMAESTLFALLQLLWRIARIFSGSAFLSTNTPNHGSTISSDVRFPHATSFVGSGLYGLFAELSWCATTVI